MIKNVKPIFVVLVFSTFISFSFIENRIPTEKLVPGVKAPILVLENENEMQKMNLQTENGNYTLLSFWAGYDAKSRMNNAKLCHAAEKHDKVKMISVSMDNNKSIYNAAVKQDKLNLEYCYNEAEDKHSELFKEYDLKKGFANYLIDSNGTIVAKNVSADDLNQYIK